MEKASIPKKHTKKDIDEQLAKVAEFLKKNDLKAEIQVQSVYFDQGGIGFNKVKEVSAEIEFPFAEKAKADALQKELDKDPALKKCVEIKCTVKLGYQFPDIAEVDRPLKEEGLTISHTPGTVMLVDFWATWCGPCQAPMAHNQEMLVKNESKWGDKVKIVGLSLDKEVMALVNRIKEKGWTKVDHYILPGGFQHPGPVSYGLQGIPFVVLVDKKGKIVYTGHPMSINLEDAINQLLDDKEISVGEKKDEEEKKDEKKADASKETGVPVDIYKKLRDVVKGGKVKVPKMVNQNQLDPTMKPEDFVMQSICVLMHVKKFNSDLQKVETHRQQLVLGGQMSEQAADVFEKGVLEHTKDIPEQYVVKRIRAIPLGNQGCTIF